MNKLLAFAFLLSSTQPLFARDIVSPNSKNSIKIERNGDLIRFSYCEDKTALNKCKLLGEGQYKIEDIENYKDVQKGLFSLNLLWGIIAIPSGVAVATVGGWCGIGFFPAAILLMNGALAGKDMYSNVQNIGKFESDILSDKEIIVNKKAAQASAYIKETAEETETQLLRLNPAVIEN